MFCMYYMLKEFAFVHAYICSIPANIRINPMVFMAVTFNFNL